MLIAKGYEVGFRMEKGGEIQAPKVYAILHDPSGKDWPACSVLIAPFHKGSNKIVEDELAAMYFGYDPKRGEVELPPRSLNEWTEVGVVSAIDYFRTGKYEGDWRHKFGEETKWLVFRGELPVLWRRGRLLRLEMQDGCELTERGFVFP